MTPALLVVASSNYGDYQRLGGPDETTGYKILAHDLTEMAST
jgi:hypothetical protein